MTCAAAGNRYARRRARPRDIASELRLIAAIRRIAAEAGAPMPSIESGDELLDEWLPIAVIAAWLGHASAAFTMSVYAHSQDDALKLPRAVLVEL